MRGRLISQTSEFPKLGDVSAVVARIVDGCLQKKGAARKPFGG